MSFEPAVMIFEVDPIEKLFRGNSFAYIDVVDTLGVMHLPVFDYYGIKIKIKTIMTNKEFAFGNRQVAIVLARTRNNDFQQIRKAVKEVYKQILSEDHELIELYQRAHEEGFFAELHGLRL